MISYRYLCKLVLVAGLLMGLGCESEKKQVSDENKLEGIRVVKFQTNKGDIVLELDEANAPVTTENFIKYVQDGFFDGTIFHRVIPGFVVQGGGLTPDMERKQTRAPIVNEAKNGLTNVRGTISMARTNDPDSATSQFFLNLEDNENLDYSTVNPGYAVFGKITEGMDVLDAIAAVKTTRKGMYDDVPVEPVVIESAVLVE